VIVLLRDAKIIVRFVYYNHGTPIFYSLPFALACNMGVSLVVYLYQHSCIINKPNIPPLVCNVQQFASRKL